MAITIPVQIEPRRDQWGRYLVVPPTGGKPQGYTRVTTVAKALDTGGGLAPWKAAMVAAGMMIRPGLRAQWEMLMAESNGNPWYFSEASKKACKALVEECAAVGGANDRREMGTALHAITALSDRGAPPTHLTEETMRDLAAYKAALTEYGIGIMAGAVEITVVLDEWCVAGTLDRIVSAAGFATHLIGDLKTGDSLEYSWGNIAVQLAAYAHGDDVYEQGAAPDGSLDRRLPMPHVDQNWGLIFHLPAGSAAMRVYVVDLVAGWAAFEASMWARTWHGNERDLAVDLSEFRAGAMASADSPLSVNDPPPADLTELLAQSVAQVEQERSMTESEAVASVVHTFPGATEVEPELSPRDWLQARVDAIGAHPGARATLGVRWPAEIPTLRASSTHSDEQLAVIEAVLDEVEGIHRLPFPSARPGSVEPVAQLLDLFPTQPKQTDKGAKEQ
jgi:hypothetical protein